MNMDLLVVHGVSLLTSGFFFFFLVVYGFSGGFTNGVDGGFVGWIWWWCVSSAIVVATMGLLSW